MSVETEWLCVEDAKKLRREKDATQSEGREIFQKVLSAETDSERTILLYLVGRIAQSIEEADQAIRQAERSPGMLGRKNDPVDFTAGYNSGLDAGYRGRLGAAESNMRNTVFDATYFIALMDDHRAGHSGPAQMRLLINRLLDRLNIRGMVDQIV